MKRILLSAIVLQFSVFSLVSSAGFNVEPSEVRINEIAQNIDEMRGTVMGIAEYIVEIRKNVNDMQHEVGQLRESMNKNFRFHRRDSHLHRGLEDYWVRSNSDISVDEILRRDEIAAKLERLFQAENVTQVEVIKNELTSVIEMNFLRTLAALVVTGPVQVQEKTPEIFRLMKRVLNGEMDFTPVVERLPFLIRDSETNQFILLLKTLRESERINNKRQFGGLEDVGKVVDAIGQFDLREVSEFLKEIPELFEAVETIVDGAEEYF